MAINRKEDLYSTVSVSVLIVPRLSRGGLALDGRLTLSF
jgi:hypothetical protein